MSIATRSVVPVALSLMVAAGTIAMPATANELPDLGGRTITVGSDTAYPPFEFVDESGTIVGFDVDLLDAICEELNCTARFVTTGFDGIFAALRAGEFDAVASAVTITTERDRVVDFSRPYLNAGQIVTVAKDSDILGPADLFGKVVGVQLGTTGDLEAGTFTGEANVRRYQTIDLAMAALAQGDLEAVVADAPTSATIVAAQFTDRLMLVGAPFTTEYYGIAIQESTPELTEAFDLAIAELIETGKLIDIAQKWNIPAGSVAELPERAF